MNERNNTRFYMDLEKLDGKMKKKGYTKAKLSKAVHVSSCWISSLRQKPGAPHTVEIKLTLATQIRDKLSCSLQDIQSDNPPGRNPKDAIIVDFDKKAEALFNKILPNNEKYLSDVLEYINKASLDERDALSIFIAPESRTKAFKPIPAYEQWWKILYIYQLYKVLSKELDVCALQDLKDRYIKATAEITASKDEDKKKELKEILRRALSKQKVDFSIESLTTQCIHAMKESTDSQELEEKLDRILRKAITNHERSIEFLVEAHETSISETTSFLFSYFSGKSINYPEMEAQINQFKQGIL